MKRYKLKGLDCATCAIKIEEELKKRENVNFVTVNFPTSELIVDAKDESEIVEIIKRISPELEIEAEDNSESYFKEKNSENEKRKGLILITISSLLFISGIILLLNFTQFAIIITPTMAEVIKDSLFIIAYLIAGWKVLQKTVRNLTRKIVFDENFLMSIATIGAIAIHELPEAVGVMLFFTIGEFFQNLAVGKSKKSIKSLLEVKSTFANLKVDGEIVRVKPEDVEVGSLIVVKPGEKIPLDGVVVEGSSFVDTSILTGESRLKSVKEGDEVFSGMVNMDGLITVKVTKPFSDSTISRILKLVGEASSRKAKAEKFITKFARYYTPAVVFLAVSIALFPPLIFNEPITPWIYRALVLLVISCPCALVLSVPLSYFTSIGKASRDGILIKGANYIDMLNSLSIVAFDKTGTLTKGSFRVTEIVAKNGFSRDDVIKFAAIAEMYSNHPIAKSIVESWKEARKFTHLIKNYREIPGRGVSVDMVDNSIIVGNDALMHEMGIEHDSCYVEGTVVHVAINGIYAGYVIISDEIKDDASKAVEELKKLGCKVVMLTGDSKEIAKRVASKLELDEYHAELLPEDKVRVIEMLKEKDGDGKVAFAGDGINDAPVIARADVGIAMGALGSEAAIEVADVVIMDDMPSKVARSIRISKATQKIVWENISLALAIKGFFIILGSLGMATMWEAVFADIGVTLIAIFNAMRMLYLKF